MPAVRGYAALPARRGPDGRRAGTRCRCAMVVVLSQPRWVVKGSDMSGNEAVTAADGDSAQGSARISTEESQDPQLRGGTPRPQKKKAGLRRARRSAWRSLLFPCWLGLA